MDAAEVGELVRRSFEMEDLPQVSIDKLVDNGTGFVSDILNLEVGWASKTDSQKLEIPEHMILKQPTVVDGKQNFSDKWMDAAWEKTAGNEAGILAFENSIQQRVHNTECYCYEIFQLHGNFFENLTVPKVYSLQPMGKDPGYILMENLYASGREMADFGVSMDSRHIFAVIDQLVELHVFSFLHPEVLEMLDEFPLFAYKFFPFHKDAIVKFLESDHHNVYHFSRAQIDTILDFDNFASQKEYKGAMVLVQGSLWPQNIFLGPEGVEPALIDWQMAHRGAPSEDLCRLLTSALSPEMRRQHESEIIEYYLENMKKSCEKFQISMPFTDEEFLESYLHNFTFCSAILLGQVGMMLQHSYKRETKFRQGEILIRAVAACNDASNINKGH